MTLTSNLTRILTPIEGGWRVRTADTCHVDIYTMGWANLRVVLTELGDVGTYTRGWCFQRPLQDVVLLALAFDPDSDDPREAEPIGWIKESGSERRACGWLYPAGTCRGYLPSCERCRTQRTR